MRWLLNRGEHHLPRRLVVLLGAGAVAVLLLAAGLLWWREPPSAAALHAAVEQDVKALLVVVNDAAPKDMAAELGGARRRLTRRYQGLQRSMARLEAESAAAGERDLLARTAASLVALLAQMTDWEGRLKAGGSAGAEAAVQAVKIDVLRERLRWSPGRVVDDGRRYWRPRTVWQSFQDGVGIAALWPWRLVRGIAGSGTGSFGDFRRMLFPLRSGGRFPFVRLVGFGLSALTLGYGLCWLGSRHSMAWIAYLGLGYFLYMLFFGIGTILLYAGLLG